ncbi:alpha/beta fold hydrolase [Dactylosporangium sp. NPDC049742]|uniref:alpha/beta hydrolase family protein n=1 Tax=Dactylosporangium sp. NPDC049742 TaxID=3154737 RepID=UPI0034126292
MTTPVREVELRFPDADRDLAGALILPGGAGPFPAAVPVSGSGPVDRDSNAPRLAIDSTRQQAHALARAGIATLRYDKRGVGGSRLLRDGTVEGKDGWMRAGLFDNADDVVAAFTALAERPDTDAGRLFLVGHSEGSTLVTIAAARTSHAPAGPRPAAVVLLAGAARPGDAVLRWQAGMLAPTLPSPSAACSSCCAPTWSARSAATTTRSAPPAPTSRASAAPGWPADQGAAADSH